MIEDAVAKSWNLYEKIVIDSRITSYSANHEYKNRWKVKASLKLSTSLFFPVFLNSSNDDLEF